MDKWQNLETKGGAEVETLRKRRIELEVRVKEFEGRLADVDKAEQERDKTLDKERKKVEKLKGVIDSWRVRELRCPYSYSNSRSLHRRMPRRLKSWPRSMNRRPQMLRNSCLKLKNKLRSSKTNSRPNTKLPNPQETYVHSRLNRFLHILNNIYTCAFLTAKEPSRVGNGAGNTL
jgi:hypothetical protein